MPEKITLPNDLPHLINALWHHPDCPAWLQDRLWDAINDRISGGTKMTPTYWASCLESAKPDDPEEAEDHRNWDVERPEEWPNLLEGGAQ